MERYTTSGWYRAGKFNHNHGHLEDKRSFMKQPLAEPNFLQLTEADEITFGHIITEVFGWSATVFNLDQEEDDKGTEESDWQNNEDPEAATIGQESTGTTQGDTSTDNDLATDEKIGGNEAAGAGAAGGTGGAGTSNGG